MWHNTVPILTEEQACSIVACRWHVASFAVSWTIKPLLDCHAHTHAHTRLGREEPAIRHIAPSQSQSQSQCRCRCSSAHARLNYQKQLWEQLAMPMSTLTLAPTQRRRRRRVALFKLKTKIDWHSIWAGNISFQLTAPWVLAGKMGTGENWRMSSFLVSPCLVPVCVLPLALHSRRRRRRRISSQHLSL